MLVASCGKGRRADDRPRPGEGRKISKLNNRRERNQRLYWPGRGVDGEMKIPDTRCLFESMRCTSGDAPFLKELRLVAQPCDSAGS